MPWYRDRVALAIALPTFLVHLVLAGRYDVFRDELYFIVCGRHPSFGYVDQPPLVPLLSAALYALGHQTWVLRMPAVLAAAALVWLVVRFVRLLGGGDAAAVTAGLTAAIAPMFAGITGTFNTTVFEPLAWTAIAYALARGTLLDDRRALVWSGVVAGLALEAKYSLIVWLVALAIGVLATPERRLFARRELWIGIALAVVIALPSVLWQAAHGWPFRELLQAAGAKNTVVPPLAFLANQVLVMNPLFAPLWLAGIAAPFIWRDLARMRFLSIAFVAATVLVIATHGKDYYLAGAYPAMFALGSIAFERAIRNAIVRTAYLVAASVLSVLVLPTALPILPPDRIAPYMQWLHVAPQQQEKNFAGTALPQEFADQLGWRDYVRQVGTAWVALPPQVRADTGILVSNYGEAGALDVYGAPYGFPPALSGHNQYHLWGLRGQNPRNLLRIRPTLDGLKTQCTSFQVLGKVFSPYAMAWENNRLIVLCNGMRPPLAQQWNDFKHYE
ncbi:MAG TPA: glycosyltransferase family 39 protein [Candidatus Elarobacter sp.]|nr:glycosyltransferase family 39 protein [Candidatus Elarobacter sp.]